MAISYESITGAQRRCRCLWHLRVPEHTSIGVASEPRSRKHRRREPLTHFRWYGYALS